MSATTSKRRIHRAPRPIINIGRFRLDPPGPDRSFVDNLKFFLFVAALLALFVWLSRLQADWLTSRNAARQTPILAPNVAAPAP